MSNGVMEQQKVAALNAIAATLRLILAELQKLTGQAGPPAGPPKAP